MRLRALRLAAQGLLAPSCTTAREVVGRQLALQGQDYPGAKWSIGVRAPGLTRAEVDAALAAGEIVRGWPLRGTLMFMEAADLGWLTALTAERMLRSLAGRHRRLELDETTFNRAADVAGKALADGPLSREALFARWTEAGLEPVGQRGVHLLSGLSQRGLLCLGPPAGAGQAVVLSETWIRAPRRLEGDEALVACVTRYLAGHGAASDRDLAWWAGLTLTEVRRGLAAAGPRVVREEIDGAPYWRPAELEAPPPDEVAASFLLLSGFDEYLLGHQDRTAALSPEHFERVVPGSNGMFLSTMVAAGRVVGLWRRKPRGRRVELIPEPFEAIDAAAFNRAAEVYTRFAPGA